MRFRILSRFKPLVVVPIEKNLSKSGAQLEHRIPLSLSQRRVEVTPI